MSIKFLVLGGGGILGFFGGGSADFMFMGARIFLIEVLLLIDPRESIHANWGDSRCEPWGHLISLLFRVSSAIFSLIFLGFLLGLRGVANPWCLCGFPWFVLGKHQGMEGQDLYIVTQRAEPGKKTKKSWHSFRC